MKILVIDIETTGLNPLQDKILEVGIVELNLLTGEIKTIFDKLCHERPISLDDVKNSWIEKNGFITVEEVRHSPQFQTISEEIQSIVSNYEGATAFNKSFDFSFLKNRGIKFKREFPCPMLLSTDICKIPSPRGYKWPKAQEAYDFFFPNSGYSEKHRGADDAVHEAEIIHELYKRGIFKIENFN